jgi:inner membrane protein
MIFFGHIGITTGIARFYEKIFKKNKLKNNLDIDYRFIILGAVLPDLVDKPIQAVVDRGIVLEGKLIGHTLLFALFFIIMGYICLKQKKNTKVLTVGICCLIHTILDIMWVFPNVYFYPIYGIRFPLHLDSSNLPAYAYMYLSFYKGFEIIGLVIMAKCYYKSIKYNGLIKFIKDGKLKN